jgi:hypothetical protein
MRRSARICSGLLALTLSACGGGVGETGGQGGSLAGAGPTGVEADVGRAVVSLVRAFELPDDIVSAVLLGEGPVAIDTTDGEGDTDSLWVETLDIDEDGSMNETRLIWDDEDAILYAHAFETFDCLHGDGTADSGMLVAVYGEGNTRGEPPGSGFYVVGLDAGECAARNAMLWGCRFDEAGKKTKCGEATLDVATGSFEISTVQPLD